MRNIIIWNFKLEFELANQIKKYDWMANVVQIFFIALTYTCNLGLWPQNFWPMTLECWVPRNWLKEQKEMTWHGRQADSQMADQKFGPLGGAMWGHSPGLRVI